MTLLALITCAMRERFDSVFVGSAMIFDALWVLPHAWGLV